MQKVEIQPARNEKILKVLEKKSSLETRCSLQGAWLDTNVKTGDVVSVQGIWSQERQLYLITNEAGIIVTSPDLLISGTSVVGSLFCARKTVLADRFKPVEFSDAKVVSEENKTLIQMIILLYCVVDACRKSCARDNSESSKIEFNYGEGNQKTFRRNAEKPRHHPSLVFFPNDCESDER